MTHRSKERPATNLNPMSSADVQGILEQAVPPRALQADGSYYTSPPSWGVYEIELPAQDGRAKRYRIGNHPVRQRELTEEFGKVKQVALFTSRTLAEELGRLLNARSPR